MGKNFKIVGGLFFNGSLEALEITNNIVMSC